MRTDKFTQVYSGQPHLDREPGRFSTEKYAQNFILFGLRSFTNRLKAGAALGGAGWRMFSCEQISTTHNAINVVL